MATYSIGDFDRRTLMKVTAVLAASALARGQFEPSGLVRADQQVQPEALLAYLRRFDVTFTQARA